MNTGLREIRRYFQKERQSAIRRFRKQKRLNMMASPGRHKFIVVLDHLKPAFNIGKIFRSADAFGAAEVHLISTHFFDPAPAKGEKLPEAHMPAKSAFIFGNEEFGHSFNNDNYSRIKSLKIPQFDRVESLNVSIAASIVMYEYIKQNGRGKRRIDLPKAESCLGSCCPQKFPNCPK